MNEIQKAIGGFRSAIQDLLVPELKAIQVELKHHSEQFAKIDKRFEGIDKRFEAVDRRFETMDKRFEAMQQSIHNIEKTQERILERLNVRDELAENRLKIAEFESRFLRIEQVLEKELKYSASKG